MSAVAAIQVALDNAIQGDGVLTPKLRGEKVYSLLAPPLDFEAAGASIFPHIVLGQSVETRMRTFDSKFQDGVETLDVWSADLTKIEAAGICADLERILDGTQLALGSGNPRFVTGELNLVAIMSDPSGKYTHASLRYGVLSYV